MCKAIFGTASSQLLCTFHAYGIEYWSVIDELNRQMALLLPYAQFLFDDVIADQLMTYRVSQHVWDSLSIVLQLKKGCERSELRFWKICNFAPKNCGQVIFFLLLKRNADVCAISLM